MLQGRKFWKILATKWWQVRPIAGIGWVLCAKNWKEKRLVSSSWRVRIFKCGGGEGLSWWCDTFKISNSEMKWLTTELDSIQWHAISLLQNPNSWNGRCIVYQGSRMWRRSFGSALLIWKMPVVGMDLSRLWRVQSPNRWIWRLMWKGHVRCLTVVRPGLRMWKGECTTKENIWSKPSKTSLSPCHIFLYLYDEHTKLMKCM